MKKHRKTSIGMAAFVMMTLLISCGQREIDSRLEEMLESESIARELQTIAEDEEAADSKHPDEPSENVLMSREPDEKHQYSHILSEFYTMYEDKMYFAIKKGNARKTRAVQSVGWYDTVQEVGGVMCPDPLCNHMDETQCLYAGIESLPMFEDENTCYVLRTESTNDGVFFNTYRYRLDTQQIQLVFQPESFEGSRLLGVHEGRLYLTFTESRQLENRQTVKAEYLAVIDTATDEMLIKKQMPDQYRRFMFIHQNRLYWIQGKEIISTDLRGEGERVECQSAGVFDNWYFDTRTEELYFNVADQEERTGRLYCWANGVVREISLPDEEIYSFYLGVDKIYYTVYDPQYYGISNAPDHPPTYDYNGGKIYAADRENPNKRELIYDSKGERVVHHGSVMTYAVFGDKLLFSEVGILRETIGGQEYVTFNISMDMGKYVIDLTDGVEEVIGY